MNTKTMKIAPPQEHRHLRSRQKLTALSLEDLDPFPLQTTFFQNCTDGEDAALEEDLRCNGQRDPIEVLPPNPRKGRRRYQILDGHRRCQLLQRIGERQARVLIRHDLRDADDQEIKGVFLLYNFTRRQLTMLEQARIAVEMIKLERSKRTGSPRHTAGENEARDRVGKLLGKSGRHVDRLIRITRTPPEIQAVANRGLLTLVVAGKVQGMPEDRQKELAERIRGLSDKKAIKAIVGEYVGEHGIHYHSANMALSDMASKLRAWVLEMKHRTNQLSDSALTEAAPDLRDASSFINSLLTRLR